MSEKEKERDPVLFYGALALAVLIPGQLTPVSRVPATPADIFVFALAGWIILRAAVRRQWGLVWPPGFLWLFVAAAVVCALRIEPDPDRVREIAFETGVDLVQTVELFLLAPFVFLNAFRTERDLVRGAVALGVGTALTMVPALGQFAQAARSGGPLDEQTGTVRGLFGSRTLYATHLAMALPLLYALGQRARSAAARAAPAVLCLLGLATAIIAGPFLALVFGLVLVCLLAPEARGRRVGRAALVAALAVCILLLSPLRAEQIGGLGIMQRGSDQYIDLRYAEWLAGFALMRDGHRMIVGSGPGQYQKEIDAYVIEETDPTVLKLEKDFQNQYIVYGVTLGLTGLLAYVYVLLRAIGAAWRAWRQSPAGQPLHMFSLGLLAGLLAFVLCNFYANAIVRGTGLTFALLVSFAVLAERLSAPAEQGQGASAQ